MTILVNSKKVEIPTECNLKELLKQLKIENKGGMALAVNNKVVPQNRWQDFQLNENDKILIIEASQGG